MPLDEKLPDRLLTTYLKCIASKDVLYYPSQVTREANELRVSGEHRWTSTESYSRILTIQHHIYTMFRQKYDSANLLLANQVLRRLS